MTTNYKYDWIKLMLAWLGVVIMLIVLNSCSVINKVFNKSKSSVDSVATSSVSIDSVGKKDSVGVSKTETEAEGEIEITFDSTTYHINGAEYFTITPQGISTNRPVKTIKLKGKLASKTVDSVHLKEETKLKKNEDNKVAVSKKEKTVEKVVSKKRPYSFWWLLLLLVPVYIIYRQRHKLTIFPF